MYDLYNCHLIYNVIAVIIYCTDIILYVCLQDDIYLSQLRMNKTIGTRRCLVYTLYMAVP